MLMLKTATVLEAISKRRRTARPAARAGMSKNIIFAATHSAEDALVLLDATYPWRIWKDCIRNQKRF